MKRVAGHLLAIVPTVLAVGMVMITLGSLMAVNVLMAVGGQEAQGVGPGYFRTVEARADGGTPSYWGPTSVSGAQVMSVSVYNPTTNRCYAGGDSLVDAGPNTGGTGTSYCTSGCDRDVPMGGDVRELWVDCDDDTSLDAHLMTPMR